MLVAVLFRFDEPGDVAAQIGPMPLHRAGMRIDQAQWIGQCRPGAQTVDDVLLALWRGTQVAMKNLVDSDPMAAKVYESYRKFYKGVRNYHHISEQAYINARDEVFGDDEF